MGRFQPQRLEPAANPAAVPAALEKVSAKFGSNAIIQFADATNNNVGDAIEIPLTITADQLTQVLKTYLNDDDKLQDYTLQLAESGIEILTTVRGAFAQAMERDIPISTEGTLTISYFSKTPFRVRPVTRLTSSLQGHKGSILCCSFAPNSSILASGSGDCTVRLWDMMTGMPITTLTGHKAPVVCVAWSPDVQWIASGSEDHTIRVWRVSGISMSKTPEPIVLKNHKDSVTCLEFMPAHLHEHWVSETPLLLSAARDGSVKIWDILRNTVVANLAGHTKMVTAARWSALLRGTFDDPAGTGKRSVLTGPFVYTSSRDMTVRVWRARDGMPLLNMRSHGHWVNSLSTNTDGAMRYGAFDHTGVTRRYNTFAEFAAAASANWKKAWADLGEERLVTSSDDNTMSLWNLLENKEAPGATPKPIARLLGHQKAVCFACFSPNGRYIISAGFDSAIRLWDGRTGKFLHTYRGHVGPVYQLSWAADSRLFVSCSRDSTLKVWDSIDGGRALKEDLPGAADEIYAVSWSPDGAKVASGGKDQMLRLWCH